MPLIQRIRGHQRKTLRASKSSQHGKRWPSVVAVSTLIFAASQTLLVGFFVFRLLFLTLALDYIRKHPWEPVVTQLGAIIADRKLDCDNR